MGASVFAALIASELFLRFVFPIYEVVLAPHTRYLHALIPRSRQLQMDDEKSWGHFYMVRVDPAGHRGPQTSGAGARRVVVYGDSFIDARYLPLADTYPARLEKHLAALLHEPVQVVNAGVAGYGPDQESLRLEDDLRGAAPDLVVVAIFSGNDFGDLLRDKLFRPGPGGVALDRGHELGADALAPLREAGPLHLQRLLLSLRRKMAWWSERGRRHPDDEALSAGTLAEHSLEDRRREYASFLADDVIHNLVNDGYDLDNALTPSEPSSEFKRSLMAAVMGRISRTGRERGVPILFLFIPSPFDVCDGWPFAVDRSRFPEYSERAVADFLESQAQRLGVPYVNLYEAFRSGGGRTLFRQHPDQHWNAAGTDLAARLTAAAIHSGNLLSCSPTQAGPQAFARTRAFLR